MATTLTADQEPLTFYSFPIQKQEDTAQINPVDGTPDILIWGKATDGTIDGDNEIVDPDWSAKAIQEWAAKGNIRMSHDPKRPVGRGQEVHVTTDGHWVKSLITDPLAKHFIRNGVLNDYSVGISNPDFRYGDRKLDPQGKALRVITGRPDGKTRIAELSIVDRGSNFNSAFQIVRKSAASGGGFTGQMTGSAAEIAKAAPAMLANTIREEDTPVTVDLPKTATVTFSPSDLARLLEHRRIAEQRETGTAKHAAETAVYKRDIDTATRRRLAREGRALPDGSYPIESRKDAENAVTLALSGHGNVTAAKKLIRRIARKEGWHDIIERLDHARRDRKDRKKGTPAPAAAKADAGMPQAAAPPDTAAVSADTMPGAGTAAGGAGTDTAAKKTARAAKPAKNGCPSCGARCKTAFCGKCGASMTADKTAAPTPAGDATGQGARDMHPAPPHREPDGPAMEMLEHDAHMGDGDQGAEMRAAGRHENLADTSMKAALRLRTLAVPSAEGILHGLLCPAYTGSAVKAAWPGADLSLADEQAWQERALQIAATAPLDDARQASKIWQAALTLKAIPPDLYTDVMEDARKAFRDANPGPGHGPDPGEITAQRFNRPYLAAGHSAPSPGHEPPRSAPVHPGHISAADFHRDLITAGHAADSPSNGDHRPEPLPAPEVPGVPSRVFYTRLQRDSARQAMQAMHDHIAMTFPDLCPMHGPGRAGEPPAGARPVPAGVGGPVPHRAKTATAKTGKAAKVKAKKDRRRQERILLRDIRKGGLGLGEARARLTAPAAAPAEGTAKAAAPAMAPPVAAQVDPEALKAAVAGAIAPLRASARKQDKALRRQARLLGAIADQPDPAVAPYRGAALEKAAHATTAPAGPVGIQQRAALAQETLITDRIDIARNSPDPSQRVQAMWDLMDYHGLTGGRTP